VKGNLTEIKDEVIKRDYPANRATYETTKRNFDWRGTQEGQLALCALVFKVESKMSIIQALTGSSYLKYGITRETCYDYLKSVCPEVFERYEKDMGEPMPEDLPIKRVYMWFLNHIEPGSGCVKMITPEYPLQWATPEMLNEGLKRFLRS
jgi:hypothetical protein